MPSEAGLAEALDFGDVVLVPFPYTDQTGSKRRPAVVISRRAYNLARPDAVLMSITSQYRTRQHFVLRPTRAASSDASP